MLCGMRCQWLCGCASFCRAMHFVLYPTTPAAAAMLCVYEEHCRLHFVFCKTFVSLFGY